MQNSIVKQYKTIWSKLLTWLLIISSLIILVVACAEPVASNDLWWHMALGRHILKTGQFIVDHSIFTWTQATPYHVYNAWLSEIALYIVYTTTGPIGLIVLRYLIFGGFFALAVYFAIKRDIATNPLVWLIIALGMVLSFIATIIQPELFSFAFMYITVGLYFIIRAIGMRAWKLYYLFPVIIILWINSHGAFVMSALFFASVGIGELLNISFNTTYALPIKLRVHLFAALALCVIALGVNPFGYDLPLHLLYNTLTINAEILKLSTSISGWDPTSDYNSPPYYALDYLIVAMSIYVFLIWQQLKNKQIDWVIILSFLAYSFLFVKMMRTTHFFAPVFVFTSLDYLLFSMVIYTFLLSQIIKNKQIDWVIILVFLAYSLIYVQLMRTTHFLAPIFVFSSLDLLAYQQNSWIWPRTNRAKLLMATIYIILVGFIGWRSTNGAICMQESGSLLAGTLIDRKAPVEEADFIRQMKSIKKLGNTYEDGSYILYKLWPNVLTLIDVRYFPFKAWMAQYFIFQSGYNVQNFVNAHQADAWLINHKHSALIHWFSQSKNWNSLFIGPAGVVFGRASGTTTHTQISANAEFTNSTRSLLQLFQTSIVLENWPLAKRIHTYTASIAVGSVCAQYFELARNMLNVITGMSAFNHGDYATAATILRQNKQGNFIDSTNVAIWALSLLSKQAWDANNYPAARIHAIDALSLSPKNIPSIYNAAITDWQYKKLTPTIAPPVKDDITWQFLVNILLSHKEKIPSTQGFIIDVFTAMHNETLKTKPPFIVPLKLHTPINPP